MDDEDGPSPEAIRQLFGACDLNGNGYIERNELAVVCNDLDSEELHRVFQVCQLGTPFRGQPRLRSRMSIKPP